VHARRHHRPVALPPRGPTTTAFPWRWATAWTTCSRTASNASSYPAQSTGRQPHPGLPERL